MLQRFLSNHVLANLAFVVVLAMGILSYLSLPREQDPTINFNWIEITTLMPGASAEDIEKQITDVLEDAVDNLSDVRFVSSNSRNSVSRILVRFEDIDERIFDKRVTDLRREIQNKERELPDAAESPTIIEVTTANAFPTATVAVFGAAYDENLRRQAETIKSDLERLQGVDRALPIGLPDPELQVVFDPAWLETRQLPPTVLSDTVARNFQDISAGTFRVENENWLLRLVGKNADPGYLADIPIVTAAGEIALSDVAEVRRGRSEADQFVRFQGQPAILLAITKKANSNLLELVERIKQFVQQRNEWRVTTGVSVVLIDDQTEVTRNALNLMQNNAMLGLGAVLLVAWLFLGGRIALLTCIGIPFILAGAFWVLSGLGQTLNVTVLLGVVIALGMLVDDAVVVVEAIFYRLQQGMDTMNATLDALREVFAPVTTAVLTTMAAFLPLMLLPGILGKFMQVIPIVVTTALAISLVEAYWMLPAHIAAAKVNFQRPSRVHRLRIRVLRAIRRTYCRILLKVFRRPKTALAGVLLLMLGAFGMVAAGLIRFDFFASDPLRLFYVTIEMPTGAPLDDTLETLLRVEQRVQQGLHEDEVRAMISYAGQAFTEIEPLFGDRYGQILVSLQSRAPEGREVDDIIEAMRQNVVSTPGPDKISFLRIAGGPPTSKPINIKVRGDNFSELRAAASELKAALAENPAIRDISDDDSLGLRQLELRVDQDATRRAGIDPGLIARTILLLGDGEIVASLQNQGETVEVRVKAKSRERQALDEVLRISLPAADGRLVPLNQLVEQTTRRGQGNIRHYNLRRTITVEADIDKESLDTVQANDYARQRWEDIQPNYPNVSLDFSGELDDIQESLDAIGVLFLFGVGLMYLILGTQFGSYFQPLMILATVPMAFTGVVLGMWMTNNPLSLFTMYGVVALAGIAVNSAIVLISAANDRLAAGMSVLHATIYAARRRVIPILITSLTTIAGLFSLAAGLAGHSLIWGPVATAIVWGLAISTVLTLLVIPLLYRLSMGRERNRLGLKRLVRSNRSA